MIAIKNDCDFDWTLQIVNYWCCKIYVNSSNPCSLLTGGSVTKCCKSILCDQIAIDTFVFSRIHFPVYSVIKIFATVFCVMSNISRISQINSSISMFCKTVNDHQRDDCNHLIVLPAKPPVSSGIEPRFVTHQYWNVIAVSCRCSYASILTQARRSLSRLWRRATL